MARQVRLAGLLAGLDGTPDEMADLLGDLDERLRRPAWQRQAACRSVDPAIFYPTTGQGSAAAKAVCAACPVRSPCLEAALARPEDDGIWGGTTPRQRRQMRDGAATQEVGPRTQPTRDVCGTPAGAQRHRKRGEEPCPACLEAAAAYVRAWRRQKARRAG